MSEQTVSGQSMPRIVLAPMEGLVDPPMRDILTRIGGIDRCVSEFMRVTDTALNLATVERFIPEMQHGWKTRAGVPVHPQLLGSDPHWLGVNAAQLAHWGAPAIDLNFGCPAKTVNRHGGGATLLREPEQLARILTAVRAATPASVPVTAKMRLGYSDTSLTLDCARALAESGAAEIAVHARTKMDGYKPPAHWEWIARIREVVKVPVIANGEVWDQDDHQRIEAISGCESVMIGRGLVVQPDLALRISRARIGQPVEPMDWPALLPWIAEFFTQTRGRMIDRHSPGRIKQWLSLMTRQYPEAAQLFAQLRREVQADVIEQQLFELADRRRAA